jgi:hypothetical protein
LEPRKGLLIFTHMRKRKNTGFKIKMPNLFFQYEGKRWEVIYKTAELYYAVELSKKGIAQGEIKRFPVEDLVPQK